MVKASYKYNRTIILGEINNETSCSLIKDIYNINNEDQGKEISKRKHISLIFNSPGGNVYDGFGIIDVIKSSETPIYAYVYGQAQSMALIVLSACHYRYASINSTFMYHELSWEAPDGKLTYHSQEVNESKRMSELSDKILLKHTKIKPKMLNKVCKERKEWYITSKEALSLGIIDEIL
jgi:ATP-dependent Clp protease protease subunit